MIYNNESKMTVYEVTFFNLSARIFRMVSDKTSAWVRQQFAHKMG